MKHGGGSTDAPVLSSTWQEAQGSMRGVGGDMHNADEVGVDGREQTDRDDPQKNNSRTKTNPRININPRSAAPPLSQRLLQDVHPHRLTGLNV